MSSRTKNDTWVDKYFQPYDADAHARELEKNDVFNVMTNDAPPGGLKQKLAELVATNRDAQQAVLESGGSLPTVAKNFHVSSGETGVIVCDAGGLWRATITLNGEPLSFTSESRDEAMLMAERHMAEARGPRELTEAELLRLARMVQSGETVAACELYVALRLNGKDRRSEREILEDPRYRQLLDEAAITIWRFSRRDYVFDQEFEDLIVRAAAMRPLSVNTVDCLYDKFEMDKAQNARSTRPPTPVAEPETERAPAPTPEQIKASLETMSDEQLDRLRTQTLRHRGDAIRRFNARMGAR